LLQLLLRWLRWVHAFSWEISTYGYCFCLPFFSFICADLIHLPSACFCSPWSALRSVVFIHSGDCFSWKCCSISCSLLHCCGANYSGVHS
jgi:hypothetical protein